MISAVRSASGKHHTPLNDSVPIEVPLFEEGGQAALQSETDPETILITRENVHEMMAALQSSLSRFEAKVLELFLNGLTYSEIAVQTRKPQKSIDNAVQRIRKKALDRTAVFPKSNERSQQSAERYKAIPGEHQKREGIRYV